MNRVLAVTLCLLLCVVSASILLTYTHPLADKFYDLSLGWEGEAMPDDWVYDQKGWTIFTQDGRTVTELTPDGYGGFTGLDAPGRTFYFSRTLTEGLDDPTLRLGPCPWSLAVFLEGELLYTDCPEADNRIGYLTLPRPEWDREEPVVVTLPANYAGKTLTVAQGTSPRGGETRKEGDTRVCPVPVALYCGYAYESRLIAESFQVAIFATLLFLMGVSLLALFVWQVFHGKPDIGLVCAATAAFLWLTSRMALSSFTYAYFGTLAIDVVLLCRVLARTALLAFLATRSTGARRVVLALLTAQYGVLTLVFVVFQLINRDLSRLATLIDAIIPAALLTALVLGFVEWRREGSAFYGIFCPLTAAGIAGCLAGVCIIPPLRHEVWEQLSFGAVGYFTASLTFLMMATAIIAAVTVAIRREVERRMESRLLAQRRELAQASYRAMRTHQEQVMILRHDMAKHLRLLRQMTGEEQAQAYLDELIGENEKIRPVIQSGNEMLDIILNGEITAAADAGIHVEVVRAQAPETLPLSSVELCSLFMNVMDNAITAAQSSGAERPYIRLDLHLKNEFFVFSCRNSADRNREKRAGTQDPFPRHGLGLKIIRSISQRYGDLLETEYGADYYKVILAIPLNRPDSA